MDEYFAQYGAMHRKFRHHLEGIGEAGELFGERAATAAAIHVIRDCRHIPRKRDYEIGYVDPLGLKTSWSTASYIKYSEEDFESLVEQLLKPSAVVLWSFVDLPSLQLLLASLTRLDPAAITNLTSDWQKATDKREAFPPLNGAEVGLSQVDTSDAAVLEHFRQIEQTPLFKSIAPGRQVSIAYVKLDRLINPLVFLDYELLDTLKAELPIIDDLHIARFALPAVLSVRINAMVDPTLRSVLFVSNEKTLTIGPVQVQQTPQGTEVKFMVGSTPSLMVVGNNSGRLILRNGIHRAFLLAKMGVKVAPCVVVEEVGPVLAHSVTAYPSFSPPVLTYPRPPMLLDFFDPELTIQVPLLRTNKLIRISAEETIIPVD
jgi:hypothetical protein